MKTGDSARGGRPQGRRAFLGYVVLALLSGLFLPAFPARGGPPPTRPPIRLSDPGLFHRLSDAPPRVFRLEADSTLDSSRSASSRPFDRYVKIERPLASRKALAKLLDTVARQPWTRTPVWPSPSRPTLAIRFGPDSLGPDLLFSLEDVRVALFLAGEKGITTQLPDTNRTMLAWCVWGIDPENPEALPIVTEDLLRHGSDPYSVPSWLDFLGDFERPRPSPWITKSEGEPPAVVTAEKAVYPAMAKEAQVTGRVQLYALVGRDGRVQRVIVTRGVNLLTQAAAEAVKRWVFKPAIVSGKPVESWTDASVEFP